MAQFFDYDPLTGVTEYFDYDESTGEAKIIHSQDVSAALDRSKSLANTGATDQGIKKGMWNYATLPQTVQIAMRAKGIDIYSKEPSMVNRMLKEIDENYPWCKNTTKKHRVQNIRHL